MVSTCKTFSDFHRCCRDRRAWETACEDQRNGSWRALQVKKPFDDSDMEYLRLWVLSQGIVETDEMVFLWISW